MDVPADVDRVGPRAAPCPVGAGNEGGIKTPQSLDRFPQRSVTLLGFGREDLNGEAELTRLVDLGDPHAVSAAHAPVGPAMSAATERAAIRLHTDVVFFMVFPPCESDRF